MNVIIFPADDNSDTDLQDEDIPETSSSRTEHLSTLSQKSENTLWNKFAVSQSNENQDTAKERTMFRTSEDMCQQFLKLGAPLLFHPGQLSVKPQAFSTTGMGHLFSSLPGVNNLENGGISSQSITSPSPFMFHLSQHVLTSQVGFSWQTAC